MLYDNGYTFADLAKEDLDLGILRALYIELGILANSPNGILTNSSPAEQSSHKTDQIEADRTTEVPAKSDSTTFSRPNPIQNSQGIAQSTLNQPTRIQTNERQISSSSEKHTTETSQSTATNSVKPKAEESNDKDVGMERKDYIARLIAAKNQKSSTLQSKEDKTVHTIANRKDEAVSSKDDAPGRISPKVVAEAQPEEVTIEKKKSKTLFLRQKIEALEALRKSEADLLLDNSTPVKTYETAEKADSFSHQQSLGDNLAAKSNSTKSTDAPTVASEKDDKVDTSQTSEPILVDNGDEDQNVTAKPIPGLFMTEKVSIPTTSNLDKLVHEKEQVETTTRKRPVASDFDDFKPQPASKFRKGPFGVGFNQDLDNEEMIIEVSEDDWCSSESESENTTERSSTAHDAHLSSSLSARKPSVMKDLPPLSDFPRRSSLAKRSSYYPGSGGISPSGTQSPGSTVALSKTEEQIMAMRKKIALMEERKKKKANVGQANEPSQATDGVRLAENCNGMIDEDDIEMSSTGKILVPVQEKPPQKVGATNTEAGAEAESSGAETLLKCKSAILPNADGGETAGPSDEDSYRDESSERRGTTDATAPPVKLAQHEQLVNDIGETEEEQRKLISLRECVAKDSEVMKTSKTYSLDVNDDTRGGNISSLSDTVQENGNASTLLINIPEDQLIANRRCKNRLQIGY